MSTQFYTVFEAAILLRVSRRTIYRMIDAGQLEFLNVSLVPNRRQFRLPKQSFDLFLKSRVQRTDNGSAPSLPRTNVPHTHV